MTRISSFFVSLFHNSFCLRMAILCNQIRVRIGYYSEKLLNNLSRLKRKDDVKEVIKMGRMKCCPKCDSTNINFLVFYRPSIWKCLDCGYEGAFIIEDCELAEKMQERCQQRCNIIDWAAEEHRIDGWEVSTDNWPKI